MQPVKKLLWPTVAAIAIAGGSYFGSLGLNHGIASAESPAATAKPTVTPHSDVVAPALDLSHAFRNVHNAVKDAVVNIQIEKKGNEGQGNARIRRFNIPPGMLPPGFNIPDDNGNAPDETVHGTGSGVIVSPDGYILTNNHVVEDASDIQVKLDDGRVLKAKVIGTDPKTDLAVVKVEADHLTYAKFGDSDATEVGDWVLAFGSPLGFSQTMTQGIISAKDRQIGIISSHNPRIAGYAYEDFLQTDAAINPGNSGGPLVNLQGEVIGINSAIASNTGQYTGIGFSIPSNEARSIMESLIKNGKVVRGFLNVAIEDINDPSPDDKALADSIIHSGFHGKGALISKIAPDGPAGKGGVQSGDVVTALNGKPIDTVTQFRNQIARTTPGEKVTLTIYREGKTVDLTFAVGTQPASREIAVAQANDGDPTAVDTLGVHVKSMDQAHATQYHVAAGKGVLVTDSDQTAGGLSTGDVILRVNGAEVNSVEDFTNAVSKAKLADGVKLQIRSQDGMDRLVYIAKK